MQPTAQKPWVKSGKPTSPSGAKDECSRALQRCDNSIRMKQGLDAHGSKYEFFRNVINAVPRKFAKRVRAVILSRAKDLCNLLAAPTPHALHRTSCGVMPGILGHDNKAALSTKWNLFVAAAVLS